MRGILEEEVLAQVQKLYEKLSAIADKNFEISLPAPDLIPKLRDKFRFTIMLKGKTGKDVVKSIYPGLLDFKKRKGVILTIDVCP